MGLGGGQARTHGCGGWGRGRRAHPGEGAGGAGAHTWGVLVGGQALTRRRGVLRRGSIQSGDPVPMWRYFPPIPGLCGQQVGGAIASPRNSQAQRPQECSAVRVGCKGPVPWGPQHTSGPEDEACTHQLGSPGREGGPPLRGGASTPEEAGHPPLRGGAPTPEEAGHPHQAEGPAQNRLRQPASNCHRAAEPHLA